MRNQLLRDTDWAGMAHSLEIRVPLADVELIRRIAPLLTGAFPDKQDMARTPRVPLPTTILNRRKTGFSVPVREWLMQINERQHYERGLRGWARQVMALQPAA
jgi:asparagine synthase (glutamine-hydrolysing)